MKTVLFNEADSKAGRSIEHSAIKYPAPLQLVHVSGAHAWIRCNQLHDVVPTECLRHPAGYFLPKVTKVTKRNIRQDELPEKFIYRYNAGDDSPAISNRETFDSDLLAVAAANGWEWSRSLDGPWKPFTVEESK